MRLVLYTGKGGVGKTTTAAAAALTASRRGRRVLVASADAAHSLGDVLECALGPEPTAVAPGLDAVELDAVREAGRHWGRIREYLVSVFLYQGIEAAVADELALLPGAEELTTLLALEKHLASGDYDGVVLDCAPTDAALRLATLPDVAVGMARFVLPAMKTLSGLAVPVARHLVSIPLPESGVFREAERLVTRKLRALGARIRHPDTTVRLVVTPERMVIEEARRAWTELALFEVACDAVVLNRLLPPEAADEPFFRDALRRQDERRREIETRFAPLPVLAAPLAEDEVVGLEALAAHGERLFASDEPDAVLCSSPRVRFERDEAGAAVVIPLPEARSEELDVALVSGELVVSTPARRRAIALPRSFALLGLAEAKLEAGALRVRFERRARKDTADRA